MNLREKVDLRTRYTRAISKKREQANANARAQETAIPRYTVKLARAKLPANAGNFT